MHIWTKVFGLLFLGSVALNIYQYQQLNDLSIVPEIKAEGDLARAKHTPFTVTKNAEVAQSTTQISVKNPAPENSATIVDKTDTETLTASVSHSIDEEYSEAFFEYEFSLYLDDEVMESIKNTSEEHKIKIVNMFNNGEVRAQDIELESKVSKLFEKYRESIKSGSEEVRCNAAGCYSSYVLKDPKAMSHLFLDWPSTKGTGFGFGINYPNGTVRNIDFMFHP